MHRAVAATALAMAGAIVSVAMVAAVTAPAHAEEPLRLDEQVTDRVGALSDRTGEVEDAIDELYEDHRTRLWVVYIDSFDEYHPEEWADLTAVESELGIDDVLLAVATGNGHSGYALSVDPDYPLAEEQFDEIATIAVEPPLEENDWAGAALGAAGGFGAVRSGDDVPAPQVTPGEPEPPSGGSVLPWVIGGVVVVGLGVAGGYLLRRRRGSADPRTD